MTQASSQSDKMSTQELDTLVNDYCQKLKSGHFDGSYSMASNAVKMLQTLLVKGGGSWSTAKQAIELVRKSGDRIKEAVPTETVPLNMVRRVLKIIRDEYAVAKQKGSCDDSVQKMLSDNETTGDSYDVPVECLSETIEDSLNELLNELEASAESIAQQSLDHIYADEIIITLGRSRTVEAFLKHASTGRSFQVLLVEGAPALSGHTMAANLLKAGIDVKVITDSSAFAMMSRASKVLIGTHSVMANGGLKALSGTYNIALAAKHYSVPLICCTSMFKLTPEYMLSHDQAAFNRSGSPRDLNPLCHCDTVNPTFDYVPPELVTIFVSNIGGNSPSYVYQLLDELYNREDYLQN